jgi:hypothetical protein
MPRKIRTPGADSHQTASEIVCPQCMRHSPAFDIVADALVEDDADKIKATIRRYVQAELRHEYRSQQVKLYRDRIAALDTSEQIDPMSLRRGWNSRKTGELR